MKTLSAILLRFALAIITLWIVPTVASAASSTWDGGTGKWTDATWNPVGVPGDSGTTTNTDVATFGSQGTGGTVTIDSGRNVGGISLNGDKVWTLTGGPLVLSSGGTISSTTNDTQSSTSINSPIKLEGNATFNNANTKYTVGIHFGTGGISEDTGKTGTLTLEGIDTTGAANTIGGAIADAPSGGGTLSLAKTGIDIWTLTGANTYSGGTKVSGGTLTVGAGGTLGATTGSLDVSNPNTGAGTNVVLNLATGADTTVGSLTGTVATPGSGTNTATINTASGRNFTVNQTTAGTYAGVIAGSGTFTLGSLSTNTLTLSGTNTYSGGTVVNAGTLFLANGSGSAGSATGSGALTVNSNATIGGDGASHSSSFAINGNVIVGNGADATSQTTITGATASTITNASLTFNLDTVGQTTNELNVGASPSITFSGTTLTLDLLGSNALANGSTFTLIDGTTGVNYFGLGSNPTTTITSGLNLVLSGTNSSLYSSSFLFLSSNGQDIELEIKTAAVPEPSTWAMMLGGLGLLLFFQIRRQPR